jgi:hypothetical protein
MYPGEHELNDRRLSSMSVQSNCSKANRFADCLILRVRIASCMVPSTKSKQFAVDCSLLDLMSVNHELNALFMSRGE